MHKLFITSSFCLVWIRACYLEAKRRMAFFFLTLLTTSQIANASAPDTLWTKTFGGFFDDYGYSIAPTRDSGFIITGWSSSFNTSDGPDVYLIKINSLGDTMWTRTYGGNSIDEGHSVVETKDGGYIITGETASFGSGMSDVYLIKTDSLGDTLWTKTYGETGNEIGQSVQQTQDNGYIITGTTESYGAGLYDVYLIKTDSLGDTLWTRTYGDTDCDEGRSVSKTSDNGFIITGYTHQNFSDIYLIRTDSLGDTLWTRTYGGTNIDKGYSVFETLDSGFIISGYTGSFGIGTYNVYLIKTNLSGDTLWTKTYGGTDCNFNYTISPTRDSGFIITGWSSSFSTGDPDVYLIRANSSGDTLWTKTCGGSSWDEGRSGLETQDGGYIIVGTTYSFGVGLDCSNVYLIKVKSEQGIEEGSELKVKSSELKISKNPFIRSTVVSYSIPVKEDVSLEVYDLSGRTVKTLVNEEKEAGSYNISLNAKGFPTGIYFMKFTAGVHKETQKLILIK